MSNDLEVRAAEAALDLPSHGPGRALGQRRRPQLRLALGYQDEQRSGAPVKTDHFLPRGDDRAVAKFMAVYGDRPRAVDIRLPGSLAGFLTIRHVAFAGDFLRAVGAANFATLGRLGGPDTLTVFEREGEGKDARLVVREAAISGVDDPIARDLDVYLQMLVSFGIPNVLGLGGMAQVATRGKESMDTIWDTATDIYAQLGSYAMVAVRPKLVLKPSTMLTPLGIKAPLYVLDLWLPESLDEVYARLERHHELVPQRGGAARALLYGETAAEEPQAVSERPDSPLTPTDSVSTHRSLSGESSSSTASLPEWPDEPVGAWEPDEEPPQDRVYVEEPIGSTAYPIPETARMTVEQAGAFAFPSGRFRNQQLIDIARTDDGRDYLRWAASDWREPPEFVEALRVFTEGLPS